jgi:hypothetical protein
MIPRGALRRTEVCFGRSREFDPGVQRSANSATLSPERAPAKVRNPRAP